MSHNQPSSSSIKIVNLNDKNLLKDLKEGEIVKGTNGKFYRARKTIYPTMVGGPLGLGDPENKTLSKIEQGIIIPDLMGKKVHKSECTQEFSAFVQCLRAENSVVGPQKCKPFLKVFEDCKLMKFQDDDFHKKVIDEYMEERSKFREVGLNQKQRKFFEYLNWKSTQKSSQNESNKSPDHIS